MLATSTWWSWEESVKLEPDQWEVLLGELTRRAGCWLGEEGEGVDWSYRGQSDGGIFGLILEED